MTRMCVLVRVAALIGCWSFAAVDLAGGELRGRIVDAQTGRAIPARVYLQAESGEFLFVETGHPQGSALPYAEQWVPMPDSVERHTTVSAHPFRAELVPGRYTIEIERGKTYFPLRQSFTIGEEPVELTFRLQAWAEPARRGWYSGETHVHRRLVELANVMPAEDLNVAFPVTYWTTVGGIAPGLEPSALRRQGPSPFGPREDRGSEPIFLDRTHVILPRNTEYEIFSLGGRDRHVLGAIFILNHRTRFTDGAPPIGPIAARARAEGALLDLDKHSWPWSMMLVPVAQVDLFELSNNSVWRTNFGFKSTSVAPADWMNLDYESPGALTEWGWLNYGWEVYYALLNCGFRLAPTAGTASGVHPVPLGYSRVYVHTGEAFSLDEFLTGLKTGRSFVTTGPMLFATANDAHPGEVFAFETHEPRSVNVVVEAVSERRLEAVEFLVNGRVAHRVTPEPARTAEGAWSARVEQAVELADSGWLAVRAIEPREPGRKRFAHTAPWHVSMAGRFPTPRAEQVDYFIGQMESEIARNREVLSADALAEFESALKTYREIRGRVWE